MRKVIAVYDEDPVYAENLVRGLPREEGFPYELVLFTDTERFLAFVNETPECMVLTDPDSGRAAKEELRTHRKVYLSDEQDHAGTDRVPAVYRYQPLSKLRRAILLAFSGEEENVTPERGSKAALIAVVSPVGRCGKTGFSGTISKLLSQRERVLFLSLACWAGLYEESVQDCIGDLSDYLYACETGRDFGDNCSGDSDLPKLLRIAPVSMPEDLFRADPETIRQIIDRISEKQAIRTAVLDLGTDERMMRAFLPLAGEIYVPSLRDRVSEAKTSAFLDWVRRTFGREVHERCRVLFLPEPPRFMNTEDGPEALLWSELGDYTRRLIGEMH